MKRNITVESRIDETPRVEQVRGLFDLEATKTSRVTWSVELPIEERPWNIGLITGPSGCGKSTIARELFHGDKFVWSDAPPTWSSHEAVVDGFPPKMSIKDITALLSSVGFSSPPAWLRPYTVLSTGQRFRCDLARLLATIETIKTTGIFDEYTSVVDRTVAQVGSAAVAKTVRSRGLKFIAVTCHDDVEEWLQPDWVYLPAEEAFRWRSLRQRPGIALEVVRCTASSWKLFAPHHYLSGDLCKSAWCFLAWHVPSSPLPMYSGGEGLGVRGFSADSPLPSVGEGLGVRGVARPVCFSSWLPFVGAGPPARREHRTVVLPDYQGVGIGMRVSTLIASMWAALGFVARSTTTHPAYAQARLKSPDWELVRQPSLAAGRERKKFRRLKRATTRLTSGWRFVGPPMEERTARLLLGE